MPIVCGVEHVLPNIPLWVAVNVVFLCGFAAYRLWLERAAASDSALRKAVQSSTAFDIAMLRGGYRGAVELAFFNLVAANLIETNFHCFRHAAGSSIDKRCCAEALPLWRSRKGVDATVLDPLEARVLQALSTQVGSRETLSGALGNLQNTAEAASTVHAAMQRWHDLGLIVVPGRLFRVFDRTYGTLLFLGPLASLLFGPPREWMFLYLLSGACWWIKCLLLPQRQLTNVLTGPESVKQFTTLAYGRYIKLFELIHFPLPQDSKEWHEMWLTVPSIITACDGTHISFPK